MAGEDRRVSVYDLTGLRIHPDGYRVHQTERNLELGRYPRNIQSARGWVADDAGGSIGVPKYRRQKSVVPSECEYIEVQRDEEEEEDDPGKEIASSGGKRKKKQNNMGPIKRGRFVKDDSYLSSPSPPDQGSIDNLGMPSQDLLKNIHYAAAKFYDERGLLMNATAKYRKERRLRKLRREDALVEAMAEDTPESQSPESQSPEDSDAEPTTAAARKVNRDMYKVLDGSVLLAIGVLTQEIVNRFVCSKTRSGHVEELPSSSDGAAKAVEREEDAIGDFEEEDIEAMH